MHPYRSPYPPLEGTVPAPRALFVDRWGTVLEPPPHDVPRSGADVRFLPGALEALFRAAHAGWRVYLLGNEDAVAFGRSTLEEWRAVEGAIQSAVERAGVPLSRSYACIDHPQGVSGRRNDSVYRLPNTGVFYHASHNDGIDLGRSWVIGDSTLELVAGWRAGCRLAAVRTGLALADRTFEVEVEVFEGDLHAVVVELLERSPAAA